MGKNIIFARLTLLKILKLQTYQYCWLIAAGLFFIVSLICRIRDRKFLSVLFLTIAGFAVYMFAAMLFPFVNLWDEQYHALVAKNLMQHPLVPTLYETDWVDGHDYTNWAIAHIWLHKQPLFLWQIALSFKIFGVSELSLRLPSVLMCTLLIPIAYRVAQLLVNSRVAYFTAISATFSWFLVSLVSGKEGMEQNDVCFVFYVCASVWAFCEYMHRRRHARHGLWIWAIFIGLLSGAAIMTKWLTGLLVYLIWFFYLLFEHKLQWRQWKIPHILLAFGITLLVVLPWQLYIFNRFPELARLEFDLNFMHLSTAVEGHEGSLLYYLIILPYQYFGHGYTSFQNQVQLNAFAISSYIILALGLILLVFTIPERSHKLTLIATWLFVYLFFSIAKTKMPAYTFILCLIWFMSIGTLSEKIILLFERIIGIPSVQKIFFILFCLFSGYYQLNYGNFYNGMMEQTYHNIVHNKLIFQQLDRRLPEDCYIFGADANDGEHYNLILGVFGTFYSNRQCYQELPPIAVLEEIQRKGQSIAVFDTPFLPPEYRRKDFILIPETLRWY